MSNQLNSFMVRWFNEVWNKGNENAIDEMFHPQGKAHGLRATPLIGPKQFKPFYRKFRNTLDKIKVSVDKTLTDGNYVTAMCTVKAIHRQTKKRVKFSGVTIARIVDNKLIEGWNYFDFLSLNLKIGKITRQQLL
jgi:predicted SnoaL-like aldol condensation-catalyzing enzyme